MTPLQMKFKEIKPGMVIQCENAEERAELLKELERLGYVWFVSGMNPSEIAKLNGDCDYTIHTYSERYKNITHSNQQSDAKFSDIIINEDELTNEEVIELLFEKYKVRQVGFSMGYMYYYDELKREAWELKPKEIIEKLKEYKKSKSVKVVSKEEYDKTASDKFDELYPNGWMLEE